MAATKTATKTNVQGVAVAASLAVHAVMTVGLSLLAYHLSVSGRDPASPLGRTAVDESAVAPPVDPAGIGILVDDVGPDDSQSEPPRMTGGDRLARLDTGLAGRGGDATSREPALNLADADERMRVSPELLNRLDRDQLQRLRVARARASWEDRRSTTHPAELTFVANGNGPVIERRPRAATTPGRGVLVSSPAELRGASFASVPTEPADDPDETPRAEMRTPDARRGSSGSAPGEGLREAREAGSHRASAPIASARPDVTQGPVAVPAPTAAPPRDDVDGQQEVATLVRSLVHASTAGGLQGEGQGGSGGGGDAAAGGTHGPGSRATPLGAGDDDVYDYFTSDPRLLSYFRRIHAKIDPLWADAFPRSALFDLKQGTVIIEFTVFADGHAAVRWPPLRPSGVDAFDHNCAEAIRRAGPFPPIPRALGVTQLRIRAPFVADNPIVK